MIMLEEIAAGGDFGTSRERRRKRTFPEGQGRFQLRGFGRPYPWHRAEFIDSTACQPARTADGRLEGGSQAAAHRSVHQLPVRGGVRGVVQFPASERCQARLSFSPPALLRTRIFEQKYDTLYVFVLHPDPLKTPW